MVGGCADENNGICSALHKLPRININFYATKTADAVTAAAPMQPNGAETTTTITTVATIAAAEEAAAKITIATSVAYRLRAPQSMQAVFHFAAVTHIPYS